MGLQCGIVGLPNVGKSTIFNALTAAGIAAENYPFCTIEPNAGVVVVPDGRLQALDEIVHSKQVVPAVVGFVGIFVNLAMFFATHSAGWLAGTAMRNGVPYKAEVGLSYVQFKGLNDFVIVHNANNGWNCASPTSCSLRELCAQKRHVAGGRCRVEQRGGAMMAKWRAGTHQQLGSCTHAIACCRVQGSVYWQHSRCQ